MNLLLIERRDGSFLLKAFFGHQSYFKVYVINVFLIAKKTRVSSKNNGRFEFILHLKMTQPTNGQCKYLNKIVIENKG